MLRIGRQLIERLRFGVRVQDADLGLLVRVAQLQLDQKTVQLRFGQRVRAVKLDRILSRQHEERRRQIVPLALDRRVRLAHRLQQRRLRPGRGPIDLVGQQHVAEDRSGAKRKRAFLGVVDGRSQDVGRQQIGSELDPVELDVDRPGHRFGQRRLAHARHVLHQDRSVGQQRNHQHLDALPVAANDPGQRVDQGRNSLLGLIHVSVLRCRWTALLRRTVGVSPPVPLMLAVQPWGNRWANARRSPGPEAIPPKDSRSREPAEISHVLVREQNHA